MGVTNSIPISVNAQVLHPPHTVSPHAPAQVNLKAIRGHALNKEAEKVSQNDLAEQVKQSVKEMNVQLRLANHSIRFSMDEETKDIVIKVVDTETDKMIRQIPAEEVLRLRQHMKELSGMIVEDEV